MDFFVLSRLRSNLVLIDGGPITLLHRGQPPVDIGRLGIHLFSGDVETYMTIAASGHDLNIFTRRNYARAKVSLVPLGKQIQVVDFRMDELIYFCVDVKQNLSSWMTRKQKPSGAETV